MANRFNTIQDNRVDYQSLFVPMPLDAITNLAKDYSDRYKKGVGALTEAQDLLNKVNAIDQHSPVKEKLVKDYRNKIESLADQYMKDPGDYNNQLKLNSLVRDWSYDPTRQELEKSFIDYNKDIESITKLKEQNKYGYYNDPMNKFKGLSDKGELNPYRSKGIQSIGDYNKRAIEMMKDIKADGFDINQTYLGKDGNIYRNINGKEELASDKVKDIASMKVDDFLDTEDGQDWLRKITFDYPTANEKQIRGAAQNLLYNSAVNQIFNRPKIGGGIEKYGPKDVRDSKTNPFLLPQTKPNTNQLDDITKSVPSELQHVISNVDDGMGNKKFTFNAEALGDRKTTPTYMGKGPSQLGYNFAPVFMKILGMNDKSKAAQEDAAKTIDFIRNAAKATGVEKIDETLLKGEYSKEYVESILNNYMAYSKTISPEQIIQGSEQKLVSDNIKNGRSNYTLRGSEGKIITDEDKLEGFMKTFKANARTH